MPIPKKPCEASHSSSGLHFLPDRDGTNIHVFEEILMKQYPAQGHCFFSLRQFLPETWVGFESEKQVNGPAGFASLRFVVKVGI